MSSNPMTDAPEVYVVQPGDTLGGIARTYGTTTHVLAKMNRLQNPDRLAVGQRLVVSEKKVCAVVPLFIDRDRNPIKGLRYRIESRRASAFEGVSQLNGLGERFITKVEGDAVRILVRKLDGTWKLIHETPARVGEKLVTLKSGKIRLPLRMEPHPQTPDGLPVSDPPSAPKPKPVPIGTPHQASGDMHHPAAKGADKGMKGQQTRTPQGATDTHYSKDRPDLQKYFALYMGEKISEKDWVFAVGIIGCEIEVIKAFAHVETKRAPFDQFLRPVIQYERHVFSKCSHHRFDASNADISGKCYTSAKFTKDGTPIAATDRYVTDAYARFERAYLLDADAAIQACSWGMFQVLGVNYSDMGIKTPQEFMQLACTSEKQHLLGLFVPFAMARRDGKYGHGTLRNALMEKNWASAAWLYNGPDYKKNDYANKLKDAYEGIKAGTLHI
ncbi:N-acetylmuramidase domain-containing protein [Paraburkholderia tuberum]|uniref:N-acetylmuramidase domain-containing protein n=1 Tax=Paraburkholderia TaxID=1822464 RepID=UPI00036C7601|nr:N-acetylmuramidase domain-containing protein [Paraburkholderia tuberum]